MVTIKTIDDFIEFKKFTTTPICYVYYKESLLNAYYVGFTTQHAYYYLRNHHKMKQIKDIIKNGFSIQIYTKYNEDSLIKILKPKLNIQKGTGICGRNINYVDLKYVGEVISMTKLNLSYKDKGIQYHIENTIYKKNYKNIYSSCNIVWDNLFKDNKCVSINFDMVKYIIEKEKIKEKNKRYNTIINHELFMKIKTDDYEKVKSSILINGLCLILRFCKIPTLYNSYVIIHEVYLNNLKLLLERQHINEETLFLNRNEWYIFHSMDNYKKLYNEIIEKLKLYNYIITNITNIKNIIYELPYLYRLAITEHFNLILL